MLNYLVRWVCLCLILFLGFGCNRGGFKPPITPKEEIIPQRGIIPQIDSAIQQKITQEGGLPRCGGEKENSKLLSQTPQIEIKKKEVIKEQSNQEEPYEGIISTPQQEPMEIETKEIKWCFSFEEGLKVSKEKGKPLMVDFEASWCGWCKKLDETTYKDAQVIALSKKFIPVKVNCDTDRVTPQKYGVRGLPTIIFMDSAGATLLKIVGYRNPEDFILEMEKVK